jgi:predicted nucleic acid-binding protein
LIAFDSNVLVYAQQQADQLGRHERAFDLIALTGRANAIIPLQVLGEFLNVCRRKLGVPPEDAIGQVIDYEAIFFCPATSLEDLTIATRLCEQFDLQFFDALIATVARNAGATVLLSEDMQDGLKLDGLTVLNPFNPANHPEIDALLAAD